MRKVRQRRLKAQFLRATGRMPHEGQDSRMGWLPSEWRRLKKLATGWRKEMLHETRDMSGVGTHGVTRGR